MREILFRGKREDNGKWVEGFYTENSISYFSGAPVIEDNVGDYMVERDTVGQYIGMKDKNGKKIFEGDIIIGKFFMHERSRTYITVYENNGYYFKAIDEDTSYHPSNIDSITIIGNIHDNPELSR